MAASRGQDGPGQGCQRDGVPAQSHRGQHREQPGGDRGAADGRRSVASDAVLTAAAPAAGPGRAPARRCPPGPSSRPSGPTGGGDHRVPRHVPGPADPSSRRVRTTSALRRRVGHGHPGAEPLDHGDHVGQVVGADGHGLAGPDQAVGLGVDAVVEGVVDRGVVDGAGRQLDVDRSGRRGRPGPPGPPGPRPATRTRDHRHHHRPHRAAVGASPREFRLPSRAVTLPVDPGQPRARTQAATRSTAAGEPSVPSAAQASRAAGVGPGPARAGRGRRPAHTHDPAWRAGRPPVTAVRNATV